MRARPSPPLATNSVLADPRPLNAQESGACLLLLAAARRSQRRSLPDDDARLARRARVSLRTWRRIKPVVMASWTLTDGRRTPKRPGDAREIVGRPADSARRNGRRGRRPLPAAMEAERGRAPAAAADALSCPGPAAPPDLRALARPHGADAITALATIMDDPTAPLGARLSAAQALLDRGFGKTKPEADDKASADARRVVFRRIIVKPGEREPTGS